VHQFQEEHTGMDLSETIRLYYEAYSRHDIDAVLACLAEDVTIQFPTSPQPIKGRDRIRPVWSMVYSAVIPDIRQSNRSTVVQGNMAANEFVETGTVTIPGDVARSAGIAPGGRPYRMEMASFFHFNSQGLIDRIRSYWDTTDFAKQIGIDIGIIRSLQEQAHG
jgi:steroid delta-isomerase-like uncharacterized protein